MILVSGKDLKKDFGIREIFKDVNFEIHDNERIGLVGENGVGKSTLLKILTKEDTPSSGSITFARDMKIGYLEQQPKYDGMTVKEVIYSSFKELNDISKRMREIENDMSSCEDMDRLNRLVEIYSTLTEKYELLGGYDQETKYNTVITGLNFSEEFCNQQFETLSGGQKTKVLLAKTLLINPDLLLLDEPTNYLDIDALNWLEQYLNSYKGSVVVVSHDRYFLDNCVNNIYELTPIGIEEYQGNYSDYVVEKQRRFEERTKDYEDQQKRIKKMDEQIKWMKSTGSNVLKSKAHQIEHRLEKMDKIDKPKIFTRKMKLSLEGNTGSKKIIDFNNIAQGFDDILFSGVTGSVFANDSIGIVGHNGVGKTTLIRTLLGELPALDGDVKIGDTIKVGYLDQESKFEDDSKSILDVYCASTNTGQGQARNELAKLLFTQDEVFKQVSLLSGGEKKRLKLAILIKNNPNLLVLDEPTNHLDLTSREELEKTLIDYKGTMLFVSHDRYFLNKIANKIWELTPDGIEEINGNYDDYINKNKQAGDKKLTKKL